MIRFNGIAIDRERQTITHRGKSCRFLDKAQGNVQFRLLCHLILAGPQSAKRYARLCYGERRRHQWPRKRYGQIHGHLGMLAKKQIPYLQLRLVTGGEGYPRFYSVEPVEVR